MTFYWKISWIFPLDKTFEEQTMLLRKRLKLLKRKKNPKIIVGTDEKYCDKVRKVLHSLPKREEHWNMLKLTKKKKNLEDLVYGKCNFKKYEINNYNFLAEITTQPTHDIPRTCCFGPILVKTSRAIIWPK